MKYLKASIICWFIVIGLLLWGLYGCAPKSPEFQAAYDVHGRVYHLAAQVMETDRESKAEQVRAGQRFLANCDTYSKTVADLLVNDYGADPADVWIVQVVPKRAYMVLHHRIVVYNGWVIDNRFRPVLTLSDIEFEYTLHTMRNMAEDGWLAPVNLESLRCL